MKVVEWNPNTLDSHFEDVAIERLVRAANIIKRHAKANCPMGTIDRPMYKTGPYAEMPWTSRDAGRLKKSIRTTRKKTKSGKAFTKKKNVRVYAGNAKTYGDIIGTDYHFAVEYYTPFLRPAVDNSMSQIKQIIGVK